MRFKVLMTGWNCYEFLERSLVSVSEQSDAAFDVCVVDDASDDARQGRFIQRFCDSHGWRYVLNRERRGALFNLYHAAHDLAPADDDVLVFVDADDRLSHPDALRRLRWYYDTYDPLLTYGSYLCDPPDSDVAPAQQCPITVVDDNSYREYTRLQVPDTTWFNHLRSMRFGLFDRLNPASDFMLADGTWFMTCYDSAIMIPCFEMAAGRFLMIPEALYLYTRNNPLSDCRVGTSNIDIVHDRVFSTPPKKPLGHIIRPPDLAVDM